MTILPVCIHYRTLSNDLLSILIYVCILRTYLVGHQWWPTGRPLKIDAQCLHPLCVEHYGNWGDVVPGRFAGAKVSMSINTFAPVTPDVHRKNNVPLPRSTR
ncbi:Piso0_000396 [Millerozyma farinosa CBS 7064]|uniref:Piso0_000396 protein n=1 Tax=Pichia sorbitophila (strain ATCC MYA-4447 / BCRC 22081 / CBS 7064 / NBRC 10061 / NRRL Y-12695) TaxID=559304 RepID=G8YVB9_PICSO|nr:Piso0_000396 [Millerozyma farinosa CBS 7064]CCE73363.1 Piso0_000396 [Millerozyma farinosa CBS 7064]